MTYEAHFLDHFFKEGFLSESKMEAIFAPKLPKTGALKPHERALNKDYKPPYYLSNDDTHQLFETLRLQNTKTSAADKEKAIACYKKHCFLN